MISKFVMPYEDEYFLGWLIRLADLNHYSSVTDFLSELTGERWSTSGTRLFSVSTMLSYILSCFNATNELNVMWFIHHSTLYDFYRHFLGERALDDYLTAASLLCTGKRTYIRKMNWLNYCDRCDNGYFRTCNQFPYLDACPKCGKKLSHFLYNDKGWFMNSDVNNIRYNGLSNLIESVQLSKYYFTWEDIRRILKVKYAETLVEYDLNCRYFPWFLEEKKNMAPEIADIYDHDYFCFNEEYMSDREIFEALFIINSLFDGYGEFMNYGLNIARVYNMPLIKSNNLGSFGTILDSDQDLLKIRKPCGKVLITSLMNVGEKQTRCDSCSSEESSCEFNQKVLMRL